MNDELKMREIMAEELDKDEVTDIVDAIRRNDSKPSWVAAAILRAIDRIAALPPEPLTGKEERVKEVEQMIIDYLQPGRRWLNGCIVIEYVVDADILNNSVKDTLAEQIVATEPQAMSREEMVELMAKEIEIHPENAAAIRQGNRRCWFADGVLTTIDALAGKIPANNNEVEAWKGHLKRAQEHSAHMAKVEVKQLAKIEEFRQLAQDRYGEIMDLKAEIVRLKHTPAEGPDQLDNPSALCCTLEKIQRMAEAHLARMAEEKLAATE